MTETKFTPGPWELCDCKRPESYHIRSNAKHWSIASAMETEGCSDPSKDISDTEAKANAHLIAAAPELYEVLNEAMQRGGVIQMCLYEKALYALAKARGEV